MHILKLAAFLTCVALATSRLGLVAHELVGHGGTALALGAKVTDVQLFWFAGGWIRYEWPSASMPAALAVAMGGIAVEILAGTLLWTLCRKATLASRLYRGIGAALLVHAGWYLATGAWHGFGDGILLHHVLGRARYPVAIVAGAGACIAAYAGARGILGALAGTLPRHRALGLAAAVVAAAAIHGALAIGELRIRQDATYTETMTSERERQIAIDMQRWQREHPEAAPAQREQQHHQIERAHRTFPFAWLLGAALLAAILLAAIRARPEPHEITVQFLIRAAAAAGFAIALVIALDAAM